MNSFPNSAPAASTPTTQITAPGSSTTHPTPSSPAPSNEFAETPLDDLIEIKVHDLSPQQLMAYVQRCATLRSSAQTKNAELRKEAGATKKSSTPKRPKEGVDLAKELLSKLID